MRTQVRVKAKLPLTSHYWGDRIAHVVERRICDPRVVGFNPVGINSLQSFSYFSIHGASPSLKKKHPGGEKKDSTIQNLFVVF